MQAVVTLIPDVIVECAERAERAHAYATAGTGTCICKNGHMHMPRQERGSPGLVDWVEKLREVRAVRAVRQ